ncbi:hypothetical protein CDAR_195551 [Caerostris darwini]|uniref:Uncharacterized protein n=1 Tax=Caerostris darwini TaxID=1538125 RepID=A0AAV4NAV9_9ARAC|nr:hypothetical protein CDAR_195551 [Caerostris darwini]
MSGVKAGLKKRRYEDLGLYYPAVSVPSPLESSFLGLFRRAALSKWVLSEEQIGTDSPLRTPILAHLFLKYRSDIITNGKSGGLEVSNSKVSSDFFSSETQAKRKRPPIHARRNYNILTLANQSELLRTDSLRSKKSNRPCMAGQGQYPTPPKAIRCPLSLSSIKLGRLPSFTGLGTMHHK